tara:strand:+ start:265 stop:453 length:189 start_codon:yes stop_codon:yes gene_type:complete
MKAKHLMEKLIKLDSMDTDIEFRLPVKLFGEDEDLILDFNYLFYPSVENDKFIIAFKEKKNE